MAPPCRPGRIEADSHTRAGFPAGTVPAATARGDQVTRHVRLREFLVGVEGLALFRQLVEGDDADAQARIDEVRRIVGTDEEAMYGLGMDIPELNARAGYAKWSETYDEPGNPLITVEEPVVQELVGAAPPGLALDAACGTGRHSRFLAENG